MRIGELVDEIMELLNSDTVDSSDRAMLNIDGRWTGIKDLSYNRSEKVLFIESED